MTKIALNTWNTSMVSDPRDRRKAACRFCQNFDYLTNPHKLTPYRNSQDFDSSSATSKKQNFAIAFTSGTTWKLFGLGVVSGSGKAEILFKNLGTGGINDFDDALWGIPSNNASASGATDFNLFTFYKQTGLIYGAKSGTSIWAFDPTGSAAFAETERSITYANIAEGLVHSKDDILYIPYDNKIAKNNNGAWTDVAITIPSHLFITSIGENGNFLVIAASPLSGIGKAVTYLWNRDDSLTTLTESVQWGEGIIKIIDTVDGQLVGISISDQNSQRFVPKITFRYLIGNRARKFYEFKSETGFGQLQSSKQIIDNRLYFSLGIILNGNIRQGLCSVGWSDAEAGFNFSFEKTPENDTAIDNGSTALKSFIIVGDYAIQSYIDAGSDFALSNTNNSSVFSATSIRETTINPGMDLEDMTSKKNLKAVSLAYEKLPAAGQVVLKYRVDGGSYITIFTETTDNTIVTEAIFDTNKAQFKSGREFEFRIESTGGAEITELKYEYSIDKTKI